MGSLHGCRRTTADSQEHEHESSWPGTETETEEGKWRRRMVKEEGIGHILSVF